MLAKKRKLTFEDFGEVGTTPMLVPSISSKVSLPVTIQATIDLASGFILGPFLISAYDLKHVKDFPNITFPDLIFLDSGGYECNKNQEVIDIGAYDVVNKEWTRELHKEVISGWKSNIPTVLISYDNPQEPPMPISKQIDYANELFKNKDDFIKEFLVKPEPGKYKIDSELIIKNLSSLSSFDIIGFTEKELGYNLIDRMINIAKIRLALDKNQIDSYIHVFGSLDPVTTPLYYFSGAEIFDGLSWLRFLYNDGDAYYIDSKGQKKFSIHKSLKSIWSISISNNYDYLSQLKLDLGKFQKDETFDHFGDNSEFFKDAYSNLMENLR